MLISASFSLSIAETCWSAPSPTWAMSGSRSCGSLRISCLKQVQATAHRLAFHEAWAQNVSLAPSPSEWPIVTSKHLQTTSGIGVHGCQAAETAKVESIQLYSTPLITYHYIIVIVKAIIRESCDESVGRIATEPNHAARKTWPNMPSLSLYPHAKAYVYLYVYACVRAAQNHHHTVS